MTEMLPIDEAVSVFNLATREILRNIETGVLHPIDTSTGHLLLCHRSLEIFCIENLQPDDSSIDAGDGNRP